MLHPCKVAANTLLAVAVAVLLLAGSAGATSRTGAALRILKLAPLTLRGTHFKPGEHVTLVLTRAHTRTVRKARAGHTGTFTITFKATIVDRCSTYTITVRGSGGSLIVLKPKPQCPPA
jgi:hypothetical protein